MHRILLFEDNLDLRHLRQTFEKLEFEAVFTNSIKDFEGKARSEKFDLLVISAKDTTSKTDEIFKILAASPNSSSPFLLVVDNNSFTQEGEHPLGEAGIITFPFSPGEMIYRIRQILRNASTDNSIHRSLNDLRLLLNTIPVAIVQTDSRGGFQKINRGFAHLMEMDETQLIAENFFQLCHPDDYFLERKHLDRLLKKEVNNLNYEIRLINNEGKTLVCNVRASVAWTEDGHFNFFTFIVDKIS